MTDPVQRTVPSTIPFAIPIVDISPYVRGGTTEACRSVAAELKRALQTVGFVQIRGHGIADTTLDGLMAAMDAFFAQTLEVKQTYQAPPTVNRGYTPPRGESLSLTLGLEPAASLNDYFEAFNVGVSGDAHPEVDLDESFYAANTWPYSHAMFDAESFRRGVEAYFREAGRVARTLCHIFADALEVKRELFESATSHSADVLRMINYALPAEQVVGDLEQTGMGAHTDYGIVTILWADRVPGLQVLGADGAWHNVQPAEGALLVNLGDLMARWTNDQWPSTLHRVRPPIVEGTIKRRRSAAYFHDGNVDAIIQTLPSCVGSGSRYPPIAIGDHLTNKLNSSRAGRLNTQVGPEAHRARTAKA
jgi:isopenicillin N synthase-like dioxygenase